MPIPKTYSFTRYLAAKKSLDDRALNRQVWQSLASALSSMPSQGPLRVLEVGAGIGTMVERVLSWGLLTQATYTAIDLNPHNTSEARRRLPRWARAQGFRAERQGRGKILLERGAQKVAVETETADILRFASRRRKEKKWDLLLAHAFLDLVDLSQTLPALFSLLRPGGLFYFTLNFDGVTLFQPEIDPVLDGQITSLYHQTMDPRSQTGRHLFGSLRVAGGEILEAGSSDWVVFSGPQGYPADEAYFLHFILHTIYKALKGHSRLDPKTLDRWIAQRHSQVEEGTLVFIAHQLDFLGRLPP